jgi:hypothetical protein
MALSIFRQCLRDDLGLESRFGYIFFSRRFSSSSSFIRAINDASMPPYFAHEEWIEVMAVH